VEFTAVRPWLSPGSRVLELGGGSGFQAHLMVESGCDVRSIDLAEATGWTPFFPVETYDGKTIPAANAAFDVVFSSNVLEHVRELDPLLDEIRRVLGPDGKAIHLMPSSTWRLWSSLGLAPSAVRRVRGLFGRRRTRETGASGHTPDPPASIDWGLRTNMAGTARRLFLSPFRAHGAYTNAFVEMYTFRRHRWTRVLEQNRFAVECVFGNELFYSGHGIWPSLSMRARRRLSRLLGSSCIVYIVRPDAEVATGGADGPGT